MERVKLKTGIEFLDRILGGGFNPGSLCIVIGEPLGGKELIAMEFFCEGLRLGEGSIYVTTVNFAEEVESQVASLGVDLSKYKSSSPTYRIIDLCRPTIDFSVEDSVTVTYVSAPTDLAALSSKIVDAIMRLSSLGRIRIVIDSLSSIISLASPKATLRFMFFLKAKIQLSNSVILATLERKLAEDAETESILHLANALIFLEKDKMEIRQRGKTPIEVKISFSNGKIVEAPVTRSAQKSTLSKSQKASCKTTAKSLTKNNSSTSL
ncbi:MAG: RAD55 family ATPase [Nitrososphaerota archaeon]